MKKTLKNIIDESLFNEVKKTILNESLKKKLGFLEGKPITLIRTFHTVGKWSDEKGEMDKITKDEDFYGFITNIGEYDGYETPGFWVMDDNGKMKGLVMYDKKTGDFVEGDSSYHYTYRGKTEKDERILELVKNNIIDVDDTDLNNINENKSKEVYHITCEGEPIDTFESKEIAMKHLDIYKKKHPEKEFLIEKKKYESSSEMIEKLSEMGNNEINENKKMKKIKVSSLAEAAYMAKQKKSDKFKFNGQEYNLNEYWKILEEEESQCDECKQSSNENVEESNSFVLAADAARDAGKKEFEFPKGSGKMHKVTLKKDIEVNEEKRSCNECGGGLNEEGMCNECGSGTMKESKKIKLRLTESELISMIKKMVEKSKSKIVESVPGLAVTNKVKSLSKKDTDEYIKSVGDKLKKISSFDGNDNPEFPKQIGKGEKMTVKTTEEQDEIISNTRGGGMEDLNYEYEPSENFKKRLKMSLEGDSKMGNSHEAANVIKTDTGKNLIKKSEKKKELQSKNSEVSWGHDWKSPQEVVKENNTPKMTTIIEEEIKKMKNIISYDKKTQ
jgi:hypothetical protein